MGKRFDSLLSGLTGTSTQPKQPNGRPRLTPELAAKGRLIRSQGLMVFIPKEALDNFEKKLGQRPNKRFMRQLLEQIADGTLTLSTGNGKALHNATTTTNGHHTTTAMYTLQQAARALGCRASSLYTRARMSRIAAVRQGSRYLLSQEEINRLKAVGL